MIGYFKIQQYRTILTLLAIVSIYALLLLMDCSSGHEHKYTLCLFKIITGIPCPGCGLGRSTLALLQGKFHDSFKYNILGIPINLALIVALCWLTKDCLKKSDTFFCTINKKRRLLYLSPFILITIISWIINIVRGV